MPETRDAETEPPRWHAYRRRFQDHLRQRYRAPREGPRVWWAAVRHTRARTYAEALAVLVIGFTLDDLQVLRQPGFLVGAIAALGLLILGGFIHGSTLAARVRPLDEPQGRAVLVRARWTGRVSLFLVSFVSIFWLVLFTSEVPPWAV